jgi:hypothetical protein
VGRLAVTALLLFLVIPPICASLRAESLTYSEPSANGLERLGALICEVRD